MWPILYHQLISSLYHMYVYASVNRVSIDLVTDSAPIRRQAIIWTEAMQLLVWPLWTNFSETLIKV